MNIIYLTNYIDEHDFATLVQRAFNKPNPAGQNFHGKMIAALSNYANVSIQSLIPNNEGIIEEKEFDPFGPTDFVYHSPLQGKIRRYLSQGKIIAKRIQKQFSNANPSDTYLLYDSLNFHLAKAAKKAASALGIKRIAICTDDPKNISGVTPKYIRNIKKLSAHADGYVCLTNGLVNLFNKSQAPYLVKSGIVERFSSDRNPHEKPYIYYGGALYIKDGVKALIDAYLSAKPDYDLVISGHGPYEKFLNPSALAKKRIYFLGQISKEENYQYESHASLNVNPRFFNSKLDLVSVPSKDLEYLSFPVPMAATYSSALTPLFEESWNLISNKEGDVTESLASFFKEHLNSKKKFTGLKNNVDVEKVFASFGLQAVGNDIVNFLISLNAR